MLACERPIGAGSLVVLHLLPGYALPAVGTGHRSGGALVEVARVVLLVVPSPQASGVGAGHQH